MESHPLGLLHKKHLYLSAEINITTSMLSYIVRFTFLPLVLFAMLFAVTETRADHGSGADIQYVHIGGDNYRVYYRFFRDCSGVGAPPIAGLCYSNPCNNDFGIVY